MKMDKWKEVIVEKPTFIPFVWIDRTPGGSNLGRAEFDVCQIYKRGKLSEYFVYPQQQRDMENYWHVVNPIPEGVFTISSYERLADPNVWKTGWCKEHKTVYLSIYVPTDSKFIWLNAHGIGFTRTKWDEK
jgi:hypothetical protein